jgi:hypothetical protein
MMIPPNPMRPTKAVCARYTHVDQNNNKKVRENHDDSEGFVEYARKKQITVPDPATREIVVTW